MSICNLITNSKTLISPAFLIAFFYIVVKIYIFWSMKLFSPIKTSSSCTSPLVWVIFKHTIMCRKIIILTISPHKIILTQVGVVVFVRRDVITTIRIILRCGLTPWTFPTFTCTSTKIYLRCIKINILNSINYTVPYVFSPLANSCYSFLCFRGVSIKFILFLSFVHVSHNCILLMLYKI